MNQEKIGKLIKDIRTKNNLTQKEFADKYGVTYQAVSKWENGKNIPDVALLKEISKDFNIDINDLLEGEYISKKRNKKLIIIISLIIIIGIITFLILKKDDNFSFKTLSSQCIDFNITGSIAYNSKKSSIYISDIDYCGKKDENKYNEIDCILYEKEDDKEKEIGRYKYDKSETITLDKYLKDLNIKIDDYTRTCKKYTKHSLYLKINAKDENNRLKSYKIPLSLNDGC